MKEKEIELLKKQLKKLESQDFDLEAWKTGATILLERIFGPQNQKIAQVEKIKYDQSSWALREAKGSTNMMEACKKQGKEILEIAIDELDILGRPADLEEANAEPLKAVIQGALENQLKIAQYREVVKIISSDKNLDAKKKELIEQLTEYGHDMADSILSDVLLHKTTIEKLTS